MHRLGTALRGAGGARSGPVASATPGTRRVRTDARTAGAHTRIFRDPRRARAAQGWARGARAAGPSTRYASRARAGISPRAQRPGEPRRLAAAGFDCLPAAGRAYRERPGRVAPGTP